MVMRLPEGDRISMSRAKILADIKVAMGGRIAEAMIFGEDSVTTGASSDIKMASEYARRMVTEWGMSDKLGFQAYGEQQQEVFLGQSLTQRKQISERTAQIIDEEVQAVLDDCYKAATKLLTQKKAKLELLGKTLLEHETLSGEDIRLLLDEGKAPNVPAAEAKPKKRSSVPEVSLDV